MVCLAWAGWIINPYRFEKNITKTRPAAAGRVFSVGIGSGRSVLWSGRAPACPFAFN